MFVFLHLHAAVVDALAAAQATHLFVDAQILESIRFYVHCKHLMSDTYRSF